MRRAPLSDSVAFLRRNRFFTRLVREHGTPDLRRPSTGSAKLTTGSLRTGGGDYFKALVRSIIYQQVSGKAAASILARFVALFSGKKFPTPDDVCRMPVRKLRSAGLSVQKTSYIKNLAKKFLDGTIEHRALHRMETDDIIEHLTQVRGVGVWTAHMFLIFTLNRPDVLPVGDLGIRKGFQIVYGLRTLPNEERMEKLAKPWRAHASAASWYLWRAADGAKGQQKRRGEDTLKQKRPRNSYKAALE